MKESRAEVLHVHTGRTSLDPMCVAERVVGDARVLADNATGSAPDRDWEAAWARQAERARAWHRLQSPEEKWEVPLLQCLLDSWPHRFVHLGNSRVVRDVDAHVLCPSRIRFLGNRGLSGIDGTLASAWGAAMALGQPLLVVTGDVTFAHDVGSLFSLPSDVPLSIAVLDNAGGQIFSGLPVSRVPEYEKHYVCAPTLDVRRVAAAAGFEFRSEISGSVAARTVYRLQVDPEESNAYRRRASDWFASPARRRMRA